MVWVTCLNGYFLGKKRVSFEEFLPIYLSCQQKNPEGSMEDFVEGLKVFDKDGNGFINSAELRHVLTSLGEWMTSKGLSDLQSRLGQISATVLLSTV